MTEPIRTVPLRLPGSLKEAVKAASREDGTCVNRSIAAAVAEKPAARRVLRREGGRPCRRTSCRLELYG